MKLFGLFVYSSRRQRICRGLTGKIADHRGDFDGIVAPVWYGGDVVALMR